MKANVLGTEYEIIISDKENHPMLEEFEGYCDNTVHKIVVDKIRIKKTQKRTCKNGKTKYCGMN